MKRLITFVTFLLAPLAAFAKNPDEQRFPDPIDFNVPQIRTDKSALYDYDIVYVRADRAGDEKHKRFYTDFSQP